MESFSPEQVLRGVMNNDSDVLKYLYDQMRPQIRSFIYHNGGSEQDAEDILQDGIIAFYSNVHDGKFELQSNVKITTYINQICRFRWLENRKSARTRTSVKMEESHENLQIENPTYFEEMESLEKTRKVESMFKKLGEKCKKLLLLFYYEKKKMSEINEIMGFSGNTSKNEKYRCMKKLRTLYAPNNG